MLYTKSEAKSYARAHMRGIWGAIPYPFQSNGDLDEAQLRRDVRYYVDQLKLEGLFCGGLVGECWSLTLEERKRGQEIVISEVEGKTHVIAHTGCMSIRDTVALSQHAQSAGATYVVLANPPLMPHSTIQLLDYFRAVCSEIDVGLSLFNAGETGYSLAPQQIAEIAEIENVISVKDPQMPEHIQETRRLAGDKILVCDPAEARFLDNIVTYGDKFFMCSQAPLLLQTPNWLGIREYAGKAWSGDIDGANAAAARVATVREVMRKWVTNPWMEHKLPLAEIKTWCELLGFCGRNVRLPLRPLSDAQKGEMRRDLERVGFLSAAKVA